MAGIHGDPNPDGGTFSICMSQGYEDNVDSGEKMYVTLTPSGDTRPHCCSIYVGSGMLHVITNDVRMTRISGGQDDRGVRLFPVHKLLTANAPPDANWEPVVR